MNGRPDRDNLLRRRIADALVPADGRSASDTEIEALLDAAEAAPFGESQIARILDKVRGRTPLGQQLSPQAPADAPHRGPFPSSHSEGVSMSSIPSSNVSVRRLTTPSRNSVSQRNAAALLIAAVVALLAVGGLFLPNHESAAPLAETEDRSEPSPSPTIADVSPMPAVGLSGLVARERPQPAALQRAVVGDRIATAAKEQRRIVLPDGSHLFLNENTTVAVESPRSVRLAEGEVFVEVISQRLADRAQRQPFVVRTAERDITALGTKFTVAASSDKTGVIVTQGQVKIGGVEQLIRAGQEWITHTVAPAERSPNTKRQAQSIAPAPRASHVLHWASDLMAAAQGPLVPDSQHGGGALLAVDPQGQEMKLSLRKYHVDVHIEDGFARTTIDQTYFNHQPWRMEGTFYFPLPPDASLSRLAMYVGENLMEGGMAEREHARNVFEQIVYTQKDPALLEWVDGSTFKMRVFPLEGRQEKRIVLSYTQKLPTAYGRTQYRFPAGHNLDVVRNWSTGLLVKDGAKVDWKSPSHELQAKRDGDDLLLTAQAGNVAVDRDIVLELEDRGRGLGVRGQEAEAGVARISSELHEGHRYLMLRYRPELPGELERPRRNWVFLFEASGDRDPLLARVQIEIIRTLLENSEHDDTFAVVTAGSRTQSFAESPLPCTAEQIDAAVEFLEKAHLVGALDLAQAIDACEPFLKAGKNSHLVHVGSGIPIMGERREDLLARKIPENVSYVGVGVGRRWSRQFMKTAAERSGGYFTQINPDEKVGWRAFELLSTINAPRLLNVQVLDDPAKPVFKFLNWNESISQGEEICAIARLPITAELPKSLTIRGQLDGRVYEQTVTVEDVGSKAGYLPRTWAKLEIDRLLAEDAEKNKERIIALSKQMYVMSPYTSLLVLETENMYRQFNIDRGRKDHWALYPCPEKIEVVHEPLGRPVDQPAVAQADAEKNVLDTILVRRSPQVLAWLNPAAVREGLHTRMGIDYDFNVQDSESDNGLLFYWGLQNAFINSPTQVQNSALWGGRPAGNLWSYTPQEFGDSADVWDDLTRRRRKWADVNVSSSNGVFQRLGEVRQRASASELEKRTLSFQAAAGTELLREREILLGVTPLAASGRGSRIVDMSAMRTPEILIATREGAARERGRSAGGRVSASRRAASVVDGDFTAIRRAAVPDGLAPGSRRSIRGLPGQQIAGPSDEELARPGLALRMFSGVEPSERFTVYPEAIVQNAVAPVQMIQLRMADREEVQRQLRGLDINVAGGARVKSMGDLAVPVVPLPRGYFYLGVNDPFGETDRLLNFSLSDLHEGKKLKQYAHPRGAASVLHFFGDLLSHAPGLNTLPADVLAVVEGSGVGRRGLGDSGRVDAGARSLIEKAREPRWERETLPGRAEDEAIVILHDGHDRYVYERTVSEGLRERVVCDGQTLWHLYRELGLGARRDASRFHQLELHAVIPWSLPPIEELARNADVVKIGDRTVALIPRAPSNDSAPASSNDGEPTSNPDPTVSRLPSPAWQPLIHLHLIFTPDGLLAERRIVAADTGKTLFRVTYTVDGIVLFLNADDEQLAEIKLSREPAEAPDLAPDLTELVILPLPYRTADTVLNSVTDAPKTDYRSWEEEDLLALIAADFAQGNHTRMMQAIGQKFFHRGDRRAGFYTLLASVNYGGLTVGSTRNVGNGIRVKFDAFRDHFNTEWAPLARHIDQYLTWRRSGHNREWEPIGGPSDGFVQRLNELRNVIVRWQSDDVKTLEQPLLERERRRALQAIQECRSPALAWALFSLVQAKAGDDAAFQRDLAEAARRFENVPELAYVARYERARLLSAGNEKQQARELFGDLYRRTLAAGYLPPIDESLRQAFQEGATAEWETLIWQTHELLSQHGLSAAAVALARQCRSVGDADLANKLFDRTLKSLAIDERPDVALMGVTDLQATGQVLRADRLLQKLLQDERFADEPALWRLAVNLADERNQPALAVERLERALDIEYRRLPEVINLQTLRKDYGDLLSRYEKLVDAESSSLTPNPQPPTPTLQQRVIQAVDRWRSLDADSTAACHAAARIFKKLGDTELAWAYWGTPLALQPNEAAPWLNLAKMLEGVYGQDEAEFIDRAYGQAFAAEPTNAQILWDHAQFLEQQGRSADAQVLYRQLAEGEWQPRFNTLKNQARQRIE